MCAPCARTTPLLSSSSVTLPLQYDMCLGCFDRALALSDDASAPDVWYNIGQVAVGIGDLALAYQAFKVGGQRWAAGSE